MQELQVIESWAQSLPTNSTVIEIGSFYGRSTYCWAASITTCSTLYCYDQWAGDIHPDSADSLINPDEGFPLKGDKNTYANFKENTKQFENIRATIVHNASMIDWQGPLVDAVFIDAAHANPSDWDYINYWLPKIKKGGFICGHDYNSGFPDTDSNVQQLQSMFNKPVETFPGSLWRFVI